MRKVNFLFLFVMLVSAIAIVGCGGGGGGGGNDTSGGGGGAAAGGIGKLIITSDGSKITYNGGEHNSPLTIENDEANSVSTNIKVAKDGYFTKFDTVMVPGAVETGIQAVNNVSYTLISKTVESNGVKAPKKSISKLSPITVYNTTSGDIESGSTFEVEFAAGTLVDANDNPIDSATVTFNMFHKQPKDADALTAFPGVFAGLPLVNDDEPFSAIGTTPVPFETFGYVNVEMKTDDGEEVKIADGKVATITILAPNGGSEMPLWHFNEINGQWEQVGIAIWNGSGAYVGNVRHFSWYNLDRPIVANPGTDLTLEVTVASYTSALVLSHQYEAEFYPLVGYNGTDSAWWNTDLGEAFRLFSDSMMYYWYEREEAPPEDSVVTAQINKVVELSPDNKPEITTLLNEWHNALKNPAKTPIIGARVSLQLRRTLEGFATSYNDPGVVRIINRVTGADGKVSIQIEGGYQLENSASLKVSNNGKTFSAAGYEIPEGEANVVKMEVNLGRDHYEPDNGGSTPTPENLDR